MSYSHASENSFFSVNTHQGPEFPEEMRNYNPEQDVPPNMIYRLHMRVLNKQISAAAEEAQAERNNTHMYWNELHEMFPETMRADGHKNRRCTRLTAAFLNRTRSYYALIEEEWVNDGFRITMDGDKGLHAMDIDSPPSEDDEDHNDDQNDEEENHEDPDGPEDSDNGPPDDGREEDQEDMEVENRFDNGSINDGGPHENGFHEGSAASSPLGSAARGNSPNSVLSFPSFTILHGDGDMLPNHNPLELTKANFSPLSNLIPTEDQSHETNGLENFGGVVSYVDPSVLVNSEIPGNSNVLSVEEHSVDVPSPGIGDLNTKDEDRKFSVGTMDSLPAWWRSWGFFD
ncbi:OLC1v1031213C1 [Oldenlandia corymbosa var. corymbosa]|uniref:OLC1v1031213C1 n=1 Tax=Oldenlandia corymbosa var. corymbosa TaxID=529605 RepID=A0AAV1CJX8_OLDCO|nr:OLC1v1031213C1 [Oldenlandia corymbosa var. corymbosa]